MKTQKVNVVITGARPHIIKFETKRVCNPLSPEYQLAYTENRPMTPTKLISQNKFANEIKDLTKL